MTPLIVPPSPHETDAPPQVAIRTTRKSLKTNMVIISDIHLGSEVSRAREARKAIAEWYPFERLIILGDLFDDLNFTRLRKHHFGLLDDLRRLSNPKRQVTVDWIEGNHDDKAHEMIRRIIGANVHKEMILESDGKRHLFIHGHQFDNFLIEYPRITLMANNIYDVVQRREGERKSLSRWLKRKSKGWLSVCRKVEMRALEYARSKDVDYILCGHTHYHNENTGVDGRGIKYVNTGCWTDTPSTLVTIGTDGIQKHLYH